MKRFLSHIIRITLAAAVLAVGVMVFNLIAGPARFSGAHVRRQLASRTLNYGMLFANASQVEALQWLPNAPYLGHGLIMDSELQSECPIEYGLTELLHCLHQGARLHRCCSPKRVRSRHFALLLADPSSV